MSKRVKDAKPVPTATDPLLNPDAYPHPASDIEVLETHISRLYFAADRVYKVKKTIRLDFLDYSTLDARRRFCEEELRLNRRLAGDVYREVVPIRRRADGSLGFGDAAHGEVIDYAVVMTRLPADRLMDHLLDAGEVDNDLMRRLCRRLVDFHRAAATGPGVDDHGRIEAVRGNVLGNLSEIGALADGMGEDATPISRFRTDTLERASRRFLDEHAELIARRVREGRTREGHGDLHAGNICDLVDRLVIYDCIEFSRAFRCVDVAAEVAFLAMDLDHRGYRGFSGYLAREYAALASDPELLALIPFYKTHYAAVRGKVAMIGAMGSASGSPARAAKLATARRYFDLAATYLQPPFAVITCGLPGSGKSTVARALGRRFDALVLRSDVVRKREAGHAPTDRLRAGDNEGIYTPEMTERTYARMRDETLHSMTHGRSVILDAAFPTAARREPIRDAVEAAGSALVCVQLEAPDDVIRRRLEERELDVTEASDADLAVYEAARRRFEPPSELEWKVTYGPDDDIDCLANDLIETTLRVAISRRGEPRIWVNNRDR